MAGTRVETAVLLRLYRINLALLLVNMEPGLVLVTVRHAMSLVSFRRRLRDLTIVLRSIRLWLLKVLLMVVCSCR